MDKKILALSLLTCVFLAACAPKFDKAGWPQPPVVSHMDIGKKKAYIANTRHSLETYRVAAADFQQRGSRQGISDLREEVFKFVEIYVNPIVEDAGAGENLETKLEVAKLYLLSGLVFFDLGLYDEADDILDVMDDRYGKNETLLNASVRSSVFEFGTLGEGMEALDQKLVAK